MKAYAVFACFAALLLLGSPAIRAADEPEVAAADAELTQARQLIGRQDWAGAAALLAGYTRSKPDSADGFNLLGYSYRHLKRYDESLAAYTQALTLDPKHRGAHEYIGEAYLQLGRLDKAKEHLDALDRLCFFSCEEYRDLKRAYEAARQARGN